MHLKTFGSLDVCSFKIVRITNFHRRTRVYFVLHLKFSRGHEIGSIGARALFFLLQKCPMNRNLDFSGFLLPPKSKIMLKLMKMANWKAYLNLMRDMLCARGIPYSETLAIQPLGRECSTRVCLQENFIL